MGGAGGGIDTAPSLGGQDGAKGWGAGGGGGGTGGGGGGGRQRETGRKNREGGISVRCAQMKEIQNQKVSNNNEI